VRWASQQIFYPAAHTVNGLEKDARAFRTRVVRNNGFDPQWNQTFDFPLTASELGIFLIAIYDKRERFAKDRLVSSPTPLLFFAAVFQDLG
jgi:hypothetical protein